MTDGGTDRALIGQLPKSVLYRERYPRQADCANAGDALLR